MHKKQGNHKSKPNITFTKNEKKSTQVENNWRPSNQNKKGRMENHRINWKTRFKMAINKHLSIFTLNVNGLNGPVKSHRVADWIKKQKPSIRCLQETHLRPKDTYRLKVRGWEKIFYLSPFLKEHTMNMSCPTWKGKELREALS